MVYSVVQDNIHVVFLAVTVQQVSTVQVAARSAMIVMLVKFQVRKKQLAPIVLKENMLMPRHSQHALIATRVRVLMLQPPLATAVARGHMPRTQEPASAMIVTQESIMMIQSNQIASPVLPARIIRIKGWHTVQNFAFLV